MYEYIGLAFFTARNKIWDPLRNGHCRIVVQCYEGKI